MSRDEVYDQIASAGIYGARRTDLRKKFKKADDMLGELLVKGAVFEDKRKGVVMYWTKDNYMEYLMATDPKFKLIHDMYAGKVPKAIPPKTAEIERKVSAIAKEIVNNKISNVTTQMEKKITTVASNLEKKVSTVAGNLEKKVSAVAVAEKDNGNGNDAHLTLDQFRMELDRTIAEIPTSIGWVELSAIRERVCGKYDMSKPIFYSMASQLFDQFSGRYELSSGGREGVIVRGLVHGFVRRI